MGTEEKEGYLANKPAVEETKPMSELMFDHLKEEQPGEFDDSLWDSRIEYANNAIDACEDAMRYYRERDSSPLKDAAPELLAACEDMKKLIESLSDSIPWGDTFNLDIKLLNEAPIRCGRAISKAKGGEG